MLLSMCSQLWAEAIMLNYSLWPRRPEAIAEARSLILQQELDQALKVLAPYVKEKNIGGKEARGLTARINKRRYLSRQNPHATIYQVRSGDHVARIAQANQTPLDFLFLLNGIIEPSRLNIGQKLVVAPMTLRLEIDAKEQELRVWDADVLVAVYPVTVSEGAHEGAADASDLKVSDRFAYDQGRRVSPQSMNYMSANRVLKLSNGAYIHGEQSIPGATGSYRLAQRDINELALLVRAGTRVEVL